MGFRVDEKRIVHLDPDTNEFGDTRIEKNPTSTQTHCAQYPLIVHSLILRRAGKRTNKAIGDNCPLIYALKGRDGLSVTYSSVKPMIRLFNNLLNKFTRQIVAKNTQYDVLIPMPSNHKLSMWLANRLSRLIQVQVFQDAFHKITTAEVEELLLLDRFNHHSIPHDARSNIINAVKKARDDDKPFSISNVKTLHRKYLTPVVLRSTQISNTARILLVDDLFASGRTLVAAKNEIMKHHPETKIEALCLFSPINGRARKP